MAVQWIASKKWSAYGTVHGLGQVLPSHGRQLLNRGTLSRVRCQLQLRHISQNWAAKQLKFVPDLWILHDTSISLVSLDAFEVV
jgi:hypothetical protein